MHEVSTVGDPCGLVLGLAAVRQLLDSGSAAVTRVANFTRLGFHPSGVYWDADGEVGPGWYAADVDSGAFEPAECWHQKRVRCPFGSEGSRFWVRESFWELHDTDGEAGQVWSCGSNLTLGPDFHPGIQYAASPPGLDPPDGARPGRGDKPGAWYQVPPDDWDGAGSLDGRMVWEFGTWAPGYYSAYGGAAMPRWASRLVVASRGVSCGCRGDAWVWSATLVVAPDRSAVKSG